MTEKKKNISLRSTGHHQLPRGRNGPRCEYRCRFTARIRTNLPESRLGRTLTRWKFGRPKSSTLVEVLAKADISSDEIAAIGITNQRETTIVWERETGKPIYNAICGGVVVPRISAKSSNATVWKSTSVIIQVWSLTPYFSGTKVKWILDHVEGSRERCSSRRTAVRYRRCTAYLENDAGTCTRHGLPTPHVPCCSTSTPWTGMTRCWMRWIFRVQCCLKFVALLEVYGQTNIGGKGGIRIPISGIAGDQRRRCLASCA